MDRSNQLNLILNQYGESHQNPTNQIIHKVCVPLILWSLLGLLSLIPAPINAAYLLIGLGLIYYAKFRNLYVYFIIFVQIVPMMIAIYFLQDQGYKFWLGIFIIAWIGQFIGHKIEGKKPSFFQDIFFLLIGPVWILKKFVK